MTTIETFKAYPRTKTGGSAARLLRRSGLIPGILYGAQKENFPLQVDPRDVEKQMRRTGFYTKIFALDIEGKTERALARAVQLHPVTDRPLHIDFWRVTKDTKIHVAVPVHFLNEATCPGLKQGGLLNVVLRDIEVTCSAENIPADLTVDLAGMPIGASIHLDALHLPQGVAVTHPERDHTIATIVPPKVAAEQKES